MQLKIVIDFFILGKYPGLVLELSKATKHIGEYLHETPNLQQLGQLQPSVQRAGHEGHLQRDAGQGDVGPRDGEQQTSGPH